MTGMAIPKDGSINCAATEVMMRTKIALRVRVPKYEVYAQDHN